MQCCCVHLVFGTCLRAQVLVQNRDVCAAEDTYIVYLFVTIAICLSVVLAMLRLSSMQKNREGTNKQQCRKSQHDM